MAEMKKAQAVESSKKIIFSHAGGKRGFVYPPLGPGDYNGVGREIMGSGLEVPKGDHTALLLHAVYCSTELQNEPGLLEKMKFILGHGGLYVFEINLWTSNGLYAISDPKSRGLIEHLNPADIEKKLKGAKELSWGGIRFSKDESVRFAPRGSYSLGRHLPEEIATQGNIVATYGVEGARLLGEVSSKFLYFPKTFGVDIEEGEQPAQRLAGIYASPIGCRLHFGGSDLGCLGQGYAFGGLKKV